MSAISSTSAASWLRAAASLDVDAPAAPLRPGSLLSRGRFRVVRELGRGGMGVVYQAFDHAREQTVALKTLLRLSPRHLQHLKQEFRALSELSHPNVVRLHGLHCDDGVWFITMQLVEGTTLAARPFAPHDLHPLFVQIARGVDALHRAGLIHRDLKPSNVMVSQRGEVVIVDFGLVSALDSPVRASNERFCGTPSYAAPEQKAGANVQAPADWYAFGVMLQEQLVRARPANTPVSSLAQSEAELDALCDALLVQDPAARAGAAEVLTVFSGAAGSVLPRQEPEPPPLVGREPELLLLRDQWEATLRGEGRALLIRGDSGLGKTALVAQFRRELEAQEGALWWIHGACYPREAIAYNAFDAVVDGLTRHLQSLPVAQQEALWPADAEPLLRMFPVLASVQRPERAQGVEDASTDASELRARAYASLKRLLIQVARGRPLVIQIDDLHWGDAESAALLTELLRSKELPQVLFLLAARSDEAVRADLKSSRRGAWRRHTALGPLLRSAPSTPCLAALRGAVTELTLKPLTLPQATVVAAQLLGRPTSDAECVALATESRGHPFVLRELCIYTRSAGAHRPSLTLDALLQRRIAALSAQERITAQLVALSARPLTASQCGSALALCAAGPRSAAASLVDGLCAAQLLRRSLSYGVEVVEAYHARIGEALAASLEPHEPRRLHAALAETIESSAPLEDEAIIEHLLGAGETPRAAQRCLQAAARAFQALSFERAAALLELVLRLGLAIPEQAQSARLSLALAYASAGHAARAAEAFLAASEHSVDARHALRCNAAHQLLIGGHLERGLPLLDEVTRELGIAPPASAARAELALISQRARLWWRSLEVAPAPAPLPAALNQRLEALGLSAMGLSMVLPAQGAVLGARYLIDALDEGDAFHQTLALSAEAAFVGSLGLRHTARAERALARARQLANNAGDPIVHGFIDNAAAMGAIARGDFAQARDQCQAALAHIRRFGTRFAWEASTAQSFLALSRFYLGETDGLRSELPALLREAARRRDLLLDAMLYGGAGTLLLLLEDRHDDAAQQLERLRRSFPQGSPLLQNALLTLSTCMLHAYRADAEAVYRLSSTELPVLQRAGLMRMPLLAMGIWFMLGTSALALSRARPTQARRLLRHARQAAAQIARVPARPAAAMHLCLRALLSLHRGRTREARHDLHAAAARFREQGMLPFALVAERLQHALDAAGASTPDVLRADRALLVLGAARPERFANLVLPSFGAETRIP